jgi:hypothetical protein
MTGAHPAAARPFVAIQAALSSEPDTGGKK